MALGQVPAQLQETALRKHHHLHGLPGPRFPALDLGPGSYRDSGEGQEKDQGGPGEAEAPSERGACTSHCAAHRHGRVGFHHLHAVVLEPEYQADRPWQCDGEDRSEEHGRFTG